MSDPRVYLVAAFDALLRKAYSSKNLPKTSWTEMSGTEIRARIVDETRELIVELSRGDTFAILDEAADILNFAAMLATRSGWFKTSLKLNTLTSTELQP